VSHISFVVPVYQRPELLSELVRRVQAAVALLDCASEIILVDDCSQNDSWSIVKKLRSQYPLVVKGLRMPQNMGQHTAALVGLREAQGFWCVVLDQDLQDPPETVATLLQAAKGYDVVFGGRRGVYQALGRTFSGRSYRSLLSWLVSVPENAGMFFAIRRDAVERLLDLRVVSVSLVAMIGLANLKCCSCPTERARSKTTTYTTLLRIGAGLRMLRCVAEQRLNLVPKPIRHRIELVHCGLEAA
jgi:polyisoprenyl-phosphate glycosyltransferase